MMTDFADATVPLKRYVAREIYNAIPRTSPPATAAT
ncbi:hypothetical protein FRAHR75_940014 [Frankia sp. Hr75.2]|nr:hypothetical protein FRAHR75_940014 [Frankia sp. Hr75.2]